MSLATCLGRVRLRPCTTTLRLGRQRVLTTTAPAGHKLRAVFLNGERLDYDGRLDYERLTEEVNITWHAASSPSEVADRVAGHEVVINKEMPLSADLIAAFPPSVRLICEAGTGFNNIDVAAARAKGITVTNIPTYSTEAMAHMAITFVMALSCSLWPQAQAMGRGERAHIERCHLGGWTHFELTGKSLGLVGGLGTIGQRVASLGQALGLHVISSSRTAPAGLRPDGVEVAPLDELLARSDFVSIHCPLNAETKGLIGAAALARMRPSAYIINTARGAIIEESALVDALRHRRIAGAALDVYGEASAPPPPPPSNSPLYALDNVLLTPHIGWQRLETRQRVLSMVAENIASYSRGTPTNVVS